MKVRITRKSRNLSYGWSNTPAGNGTEIETPREESKRGGLRSIYAGYRECLRINSGGAFFRFAIFVNGRRIVSHNAVDLLYDFASRMYCDSVIVEVEQENNV